MRRKSKRVWFVVLGVFVAVSLFSFLVQKFHNNEVDAANLGAFDPGYIISDSQMSNYGSMSEADIQRFLSSKVSCNKDQNYYNYLKSNYPGFDWHFANGRIVCLPEERFGNGETIGSGDTAAHIIWQAAQDYKINPQVLIVLLQKEQGLITDPYPNTRQYRSATGYGCPDTAPCSAEYYGFKNQVRKAAEMFRTVLNGGWTNYPLGNNYIQYNPNAACGGTIVNIRSLATSALYRYTPYQPNASALAAGYGAGDSCGAYGNRNFYLYFEDWFGGITAGNDYMSSPAEIVEGNYAIVSALASNKVMDVTGGVGSARDGTNIQLYEKNGTDAQKWHINKNSDGTYSIINPATGKALDIYNAGTNNGANIQLYEHNNTCAQKWHINKNSDGTYSIFSDCASRMAIDVSGAAKNNGANIQLYERNGTDAQRWRLSLIKVVEDGEYSISSALLKTAVVDISGGAHVARDGTNIQLYEKNGTDAQKWKVKYNDDGYYSIINPATGKALDVYGGRTISGTNVQLFSYNGTCAQKWRIIEKEDGYAILSACSGLAISLKESNVNNQNNIQMSDFDDQKKTQLWNFDSQNPISVGDYTIVSDLEGGKVIDISGGAHVARDGTNIQLYEKNGTDAQKWHINKNSDGTYSIINPATGKALDVYGGRTISGTNVQLFSYNGTCAQKWWIEKNQDNSYTVFSKCSNGLVLDVWGGYTNNGTNVQVYSLNGSKAQKWKFVRI